MTALIEAILLIPALLAFVLSAFLLIEVIGALLPLRQAQAGAAPPFAVIVPAHNEAATLAPTLIDIKSQVRPGDRLLVVADNCDDATAEIAMRAGATVLIRTDMARRGKGFALQFALDALKDNPPGVALFIDADCRLGPGALVRLAGAAAAAGRPAQGLYLMRAPAEAPGSRAVAEFAWTFLNRVRMAGLYTLFDVTRLTGSGMALPWRLAADLDVAGDEIVEDLALSLRLTEAGAAPVFCPDALIESEFPLAEDAATSQRSRWELGSLRLAARRAPGLLLTGMSKGDVRLAGAALDLAIPPLALFAAGLAALIVCSLFALLIGIDAPLRFAVSALVMTGLALALAWLVFGRSILPLSKAAAAFAYLAEKAKVYGERGRRSAQAWTRTRRDGEAPKAPPDDAPSGERE